MRWHSRLCCIRLQLVPRNSPETHSDISKITYFWRFTTTIEDGTGDKSAKLNRLVERISIGSLLRHFPSTSPRTRESFISQSATRRLLTEMHHFFTALWNGFTNSVLACVGTFESCQKKSVHRSDTRWLRCHRYHVRYAIECKGASHVVV